MLASALWFYGLGYGARRLAPLFASQRAWRLLDGFVGCVMAVPVISLIWGELNESAASLVGFSGQAGPAMETTHSNSHVTMQPSGETRFLLRALSLPIVL